MRIFRDSSAIAKRYLNEASLITVSDKSIQKAVHAFEGGVIRTRDALHVGAAQIFSPDNFLTSDRRQYETALLLRLSAVLIPSA